MRLFASILTAVFAFSAGWYSVPVRAQSEYSFEIARVKYSGGGDWYGDPESLKQLLSFARRESSLSVAPDEAVVELSDEKLFAYPYLYLTGHGNIRLSEAEVLLLRRYLLGGGFLHVDDNYGLDEHLRREIKKVFPDREFRELPFNHPIFSSHYEFPDGLPKIHEHDGQPAQAFGIFDDRGRLCVLYSYESDLGDGWEPAEVHDNPPEKRLQALQMGVNILTYAMMN